MSFTCKSCNYITSDSANFSRHTKTKKHLSKTQEKVVIEPKIIIKKKDLSLDDKSLPVDDNILSSDDKSFLCNNCNNNFKFRSNLSRHKKSCHNKINNIKYDNTNTDLEKELFETKLKLEYSEKEKEFIKKMKEEQQILLNQIVNNANEIISKSQDNTKITAQAIQTVSMSALKYANEKFKNAPALIPIQNFNINNLDFNNEDNKKQLVEILIYNAKQNSLDKLLGDHIVKQYKKDKPEDQMFHTTDCSRLNYIVRQLMENALIWSIDKSGIEICSSIIKPLIKKCIDTLLEHQKYLLSEMGKGDLSKQTDVELIISILMSIDSGLLENDVNKYIAPFFNLNKN